MSNRLTRSLHQLRPLLLRARATPRQAAPTAPAALPQALEQTLELDALTSWPTHRIRSFLSSRNVR
ncbi:MAG: hypothetical protein L0H10_19960 [Comamonas sp.]|uniref:hypothetical protein n=1 Tax=Comamonas sp. TaxID=34028 RepID=UPI0026472BF6|nr:hypothetical protein [Comamonas sp.]MDN5506074.1 hypothetical protein [Comamonas sp.]MDN5538127.1 hypothetical protein [Comamonas sp.]